MGDGHPYVAGTTRALAVFFLEQHLIPEGPRPPISPSERELVAHGAYLREVHGMAKSTIEGHQNRLRFFSGLLGFDQHPSVIRELEPQQIDAFLRKSAKNNNRFSLQHIVASLRSFLQRQHAQGVIKQALHQQINTPRTYRLEKLPRALPWEQVVGTYSVPLTGPSRTANAILPFCISLPGWSAQWGVSAAEVATTWVRGRASCWSLKPKPDKPSGSR